MAEPGEGWDAAGLEHKILVAGRLWTVGDVGMVAAGQWAVGTRSVGRRDESEVVDHRFTEGQSVELTLDESSDAVGSCIWDTHRDEEST